MNDNEMTLRPCPRSRGVEAVPGRVLAVVGQDLAGRRSSAGRLARLRAMGLRNGVRIGLGFAWTRLFSLACTLWLRAAGVRIGRDCRFYGRLVIVGDPRRVTIGDRCIFHHESCLWTHDLGGGAGEIHLGRGVALGPRVVINSLARITVGAGSAFGYGCYIQDNDHGTAPRTPTLEQAPVAGPIEIGADVWCGAYTIALKGVRIGDQAVIGAGSVVVKSLPRGVVAVGVPCRPVKRRGAGAANLGDAV